MEAKRNAAFSQLIAVAGIACGPPLIGLINEATGAYLAAYHAAAAVSLAGFAALTLSGPPGVRLLSTPESRPQAGAP
jgi:hypothetical protein